MYATIALRSWIASRYYSAHDARSRNIVVQNVNAYTGRVNTRSGATSTGRSTRSGTKGCCWVVVCRQSANSHWIAYTQSYVSMHCTYDSWQIDN